MKARLLIAGVIVVALAVALNLVVFLRSSGAADAPKADAPKADAPKADAPKADAPKNEEQAIRTAMQAYEAAFNKGDLDAVMAFWTPDAEFISDDGKAARGRDAIAALTKHAFTEHKGLTVKLVNKSIRFVKPDVALQDAIVTLSAQDKAADTGPYTAVWTKIDGKWLLASVRDLPEGAPAAGSNYSALKQLEWLVGEWTGEAKDFSASLSIRWDKNQSFLIIEQTIKMIDQNLSLTQVIGWDASNQQIRSWVFDSRGGFGAAFWTRQGNEWELQVAGVLSDGRTTSSLNRWKYIDDHTADWQSTERQVDSQPMPDVKLRYTKKETKK
jgi:uncharacterized protein (TIGR02246 family)